MSLLLSPPDPRGVLLFAPGAGGDPSRYRRLLEAVCDAGFVVAATEHELLDRRTATPAALRARVADLRAPLEWLDPELPVVVAGHSAGGWAALCLLGAAAHDRQGRELDTPTEPRVARGVLIAPATAMFGDAEAVRSVSAELTVLVGTHDDVTPPETAAVLHATGGPVRVHRYEGVGHFDFMWPLPDDERPTPGLDREAFYRRLVRDVVEALG